MSTGQWTVIKSYRWIARSTMSCLCNTRHSMPPTDCSIYRSMRGIVNTNTLHFVCCHYLWSGPSTTTTTSTSSTKCVLNMNTMNFGKPTECDHSSEYTGRSHKNSIYEPSIGLECGSMVARPPLLSAARSRWKKLRKQLSIHHDLRLLLRYYYYLNWICRGGIINFMSWCRRLTTAIIIINSAPAGLLSFDSRPNP